MMRSVPTVDEAARAILDGTPPDWSGLESTEDIDTRAIVEQLRVISAVADVHRAEPGRADSLVQWGHLQVLERVGTGAYGEVFRAWDPRLSREVALKLIDARRFGAAAASPSIEEGRLLARVRHPNVVTIFGAEQIDDRIGLWMEYVSGRTLEALLRSGHQFSRYDVVEIGIELCRAVGAVHAAGLLHRDIKAQNVMRADDGRIVLMDFGTGREQAAQQTKIAGTPLCLAPEIFAGQPATVRSDVYSIGVLLYHLLTGTYPVIADSLEDLRSVHERRERVDLDVRRADLPPALARIVDRAMDADPEKRYASCEAIAADLRVLARRQTLPRWLAVAAAGIVIVLGGWTAFTAGGRSSGGRDGVAVAGLAGLPAFGAVPTLAARPTIAVLPFRNHSSAADSGIFVDGLTYELIGNLAVIEGLDVRSATSSFAFKDKDVKLADVARQLGVNAVLEGSVSGSPGEWRVQAQLAGVSGDTPLWSHRFDSKERSLLAVHDEIALAVVNQLRLKLGAGQRRYNPDPEVSDLYLRARVLTARRGSPNAEAAVALFQQITDRDQLFAPAFAGLADAYAYLSQDLPDVGGMRPERAVELMRPVAARAMQIDPMLAEAHAAMGILHSRDHAWDDAVKSFRRAIELNPSLTQAYTSYSLTTLLPLGRFDEAMTLLAEARRRDPLSLEVIREIAAQQLNNGHYDDAIQNFERVRSVDPDLPYVDLLLARALSLAGRIQEAMPIWEARSTEPGRQHWMAYAYVKAGRRAEIEAITAQHKQPFRLAMLYTALGDNDRAFVALEQAARDAPQRVVRLLVYPELAPLRSDPRFQTIRALFRLP